MAEKTLSKTTYTRPLYGRKVLKTDAKSITADNVIKVVEAAYIDHLKNRSDIDYLYNYFKGKTEVLERQKTIRPEINHKVSLNYANSIVAFKVGYTVGKPIRYVASSPDENVSKAVADLNNFMRFEGKATKDRALVEWMMIAGLGHRIVLPKKDKAARVPYSIHTLDPRNTFVIYSNDFRQKDMVGVSYETDENQNVTFTAYTDDAVYTFRRGTSALSVERNPLNAIPIIEYPANTSRLGVFEIILPILAAVSELESERLDAVAQFVQSLLVLYNCDLEEGTTANEIREAGMILLKNVGEQKADISVISEKLDQTDNETLKHSLLCSAYEIVGMPVQGDGYTSDSSNNGAVILRNGWQGAETRAEDFEAMFDEPEQKLLSLVSYICENLNSIVFDPFDVEIHFTRRNYEALMQKSQTLITLLANDYVHPQKAYEASGLFVDSEEAYIMGKQHHEEVMLEAKEQGTVE